LLEMRVDAGISFRDDPGFQCLNPYMITQKSYKITLVTFFIASIQKYPTPEKNVWHSIYWLRIKIT
jgi:hypothetical protein